ncbi:unnamed protein product [Brachionus calyciflorus]|uniref:DRBM domain-containing protein n=1 Tax=Brachionus calyciflorus TaxID=104777 RepID=A0A814FSA9_9BILA|nr:unnamed protein product [Brachionus calyciflorus]
MIYVNPLNDLLTTTSTTTQTGSNHQINYANKYLMTNGLTNQAPGQLASPQVRSSSTSSSISTISSNSTSPQAPNSQIKTKQPNHITNQIFTKNLPLQASLYPTYTTTGFTYLNPNYLYPQANNTRLLSNTANITNVTNNVNLDSNYLLPKTNQQSNTLLQGNSSLAYLPNPDCSYFIDQTTLLPPTTYLAPTFTDLTFANLTKSPYVTNRFKLNKKKFKKPPELRRVLPKNSLMLLHELRQNVEYRFVSQSGPIHRPIFTMCVDINEHKFEGSGKTKKIARMQAAEKAVEFLMSHPEYIQRQNSKNNEDEKSLTNSESHDEENLSECESEDSKNNKKFKTDCQEFNNNC